MYIKSNCALLPPFGLWSQ